MKLSRLLIFMLSCQFLFAQNPPKLVVGIVVDQMRYDYIYRFWNQFSEDGFKKMVNEGYFCRNTHYNYTPTYTGPGHASIYTGTTPSVHGIIGNNWYNKKQALMVYCAGDGNTTTICDCDNHKDIEAVEGQMSPNRMLTTTFSDELKLFNPLSKVFGISLKDRGAILPAGHLANGAYWMDNSGQWISSSYYMTQLPPWLINFQKEQPTSSFFKGSWKGKNFKYSLDSLLESKGPGAIKGTPFGNTYLKNLAIELLKNESLGQDKIPDVLTVSFSSTDYIGHQFGPHAPELVDTYIKLDQDIAQLLSFINKTIGKENVVIFLTSDHGVVSVPNELIKRNIPAGYFDASNLTSQLNQHLSNHLGDANWVLKYSNQQFFLNRQEIENQKLKPSEVQQLAADFLINIDGVENTFTAHQLHNNEYQNHFHSLIQNGYHQKRSGDVIIALEAGWIEWNSPTGTTHGSCFSYDTHVPLIFWGKGIQNGLNDYPISISDIAPTISTILGISFPNGCTGNPIPNITQ